MTPTARAVAGLAFLAAALAPARATAQQPSPAPSPTTGAGPALTLTLEEALQLGERRSESVRIADAAVLRARGQTYQARSQGLPQVNATGSYQRAIQNQFNELAKRQPVDTTALPSLCAPQIPRNATAAERAASLAAAQTCSAGGGLGGFAAAFASPNTIVLGLTGSQPLYTGGRVTAARSSAAAGRRSADVGVTSARTQVRLDVATAYFDAALTDRLVTIAESSLVQTERTYRQTALQREQGVASEFDLLRARVTRDNQRPQLVTARGNRDQAYLRLRQVLVLPLDQPLRLTTGLPVAAGASDQAVAAASRAPLEAAGLDPQQRPAAPNASNAPGAPNAPGQAPPRPAAPRNPAGEVRRARAATRADSLAWTTTAAGDTVRVRTVVVDPAEVLGEDPRARAAVDSAVAAADTSGRARATTRQSAENVTVQRNLLRISRAERLPGVSLSANYQRFAYPTPSGGGTGLAVPNSLNDFLPSFSVSLGVSLPVFTGGRIRGDVITAEANLREAEATLRQVEQLASLDSRLAVTTLEQAEAAFQASAGTSEQAARAYGIAEVRFREGVATQVELADSRLLLQQAQANAAQAARDREVARLRLRLLRDLPLSQVQGGAQSGAGGFGGRQGGGAGQQSVPNQTGGSVTGGASGAGGTGQATTGGAAGGTGQGTSGGAGQAGTTGQTTGGPQ